MPKDVADGGSRGVVLGSKCTDVRKFKDEITHWLGTFPYRYRHPGGMSLLFVRALRSQPGENTCERTHATDIQQHGRVSFVRQHPKLASVRRSRGCESASPSPRASRFGERSHPCTLSHAQHVPQLYHTTASRGSHAWMSHVNL